MGCLPVVIFKFERKNVSIKSRSIAKIDNENLGQNVRHLSRRVSAPAPKRPRDDRYSCLEIPLLCVR